MSKNICPPANSQPYASWDDTFNRSGGAFCWWPPHWRAHHLTAGLMQRTPSGLWFTASQLWADDGFGELVMDGQAWYDLPAWYDSNCQHYADPDDVRFIYI
jgi:hypothetical protein